MNYPSADVAGVNLTAGSATTAAGKSVSCSNSGSSTMCVAFGVNSNIIGDGIVAVATFDVPSGAPDPSAAIQITGVVTSDASGNGISSSGSGGTISINQPVVTPTLSSVSCTPSSVTAPGSAACTVTVSSPALTGGFGVTLASNNSNATAPPALTVPAGASSANFTATVATVSSAQTATLTASAAGVSKTFLLSIVPPPPQTWSISGTISPNGSGATVTLSGAANAAVNSDASGNFTFVGLANGSYTVTPTKTGFTFTPANQAVTISSANQTAINFTAQAQPPQTWSISGTISPSTTSSGTTLTLSGAASATATADASGNYTFGGLANGTYTVTPSKSGYTFSPANQSVTINSASQTAINFTAQAQPPQTWSISGTISPSAVGIGTTVSLSGTASATVTADSSGNYTFGGLANGAYTVTPSKGGFIFIPTSQSVTVSGANMTGIDFSDPPTPTGSLTVDVTLWQDQHSPSSNVTSPAFSTVSGNELLLAFIGTDYASGTNTTVTNVSGAGLNWVLAARTNVQHGTSEIWRAFATSPLSNVSVTATLSQSTASSMTVMSFTGIDTSGTNGSGAIGAIGSGHAASGSPAATLITTRSNSWVLGVGNDFTNAIARTPGSGQTLVHQDLPNISGVAVDTFWVQQQNSPTPLSGTGVTINDTAPTSEEYNLSLVEVLPALSGSPQTWNISGTLSPAASASGAALTLSGAASASVTADTSGNYTFSGLANGAYTVTPTKTGFTFTPVNQAVTINSSNQTAISFTAQAQPPQTWSISGAISPSATSSGTTLTLSGAASATATADASGNYTFSALANGTYTVTPSKSGYTFSPANQAVTISSASQTAINFTAQVQTWSISGTISPSATSSGTTLTLSGAASATATADASGNYTFSGLANGAYTVTPAKTGFTFTPANQAVSISSASQTAINFTAQAPTWSISGTISPTASGSGATVKLSGAASASTTADASGNYAFSGLANGAYTVTPTKTGFTFTPVNQAVTINGATQTAINFTVTQNQTSAPITTDAVVWRDRSTAGFNVSSPGFSTVSGNELLLAFIAADYQWGQNTAVTKVSGAGLTWVLAVRTRVQKGTSEIWRAFAPAPLSNVSVSASLSQKVTSSITVVSFTGVDSSGTNGSGAIGATGSGNASSGAPLATLLTTRNNSFVIGVGNDSHEPILRTPGAGQGVVHQFLVPNGNTHWVQAQSTLTPLSGTSVSINDTAPTADPYNLSILEILAAPSGGAVMTTGAVTGALTKSGEDVPRVGSSATKVGSLTMANPANGQTGQVCSPGGLAALVGTSLTTQGPQRATSFPLPTRLAGLQVKVNGIPVPLLFASDSQINFQCPALPAGSPLEITLEAEHAVAESIQSTMQPAAPGIFTLNGTNQGAVLIANTNKIAVPTNKHFPSRAAEPGEYLTIYATGLGAAVDDVAAGTPAPLDRPILLRNKISVIVGGVDIDPAFAGLAPGTAGLFQINVMVPDSVASGPDVSMYLKVILADGAIIESNAVTVAIAAKATEP